MSSTLILEQVLWPPAGSEHLMKIEDIRVSADALVLAADDEVSEMEVKLGTRFPSGYREYITRLGEGTLGGHYIRIYPPWRILTGDNNFNEWRQRIDEYWFWDEGRKVLSKEKALECVIVGDTVNGDEMIFHPADPDVIYVLPREEETIYKIGSGLFKKPGLLTAIEWLVSSGKLTSKIRERDFEPFDSRESS